MIPEFDIYAYKKNNQPIIIYGAGVFGEYTLRALQKNGVVPICFCDRAKAGKQYLGVEVKDYKEILKQENPIVLLAVGTAFHEVLEFLMEKGISNIYQIYKLVFEDTELQMENISSQGQDIIYYKELYRFGLKYKKNSESFFMNSLDWMITTRCSLKCKECSNLMQYYQHPQNFSEEVLQEELYKILEIVDGIMDVRVLGGEPFMNPKMSEIMKPFLDNPKIHNFSIYTNATIFPDETMLQVLKHPKVKCEISDYNGLVKNFSRFVELMEKEKIRHHVVEIKEWHKLGGLKDRKKDEEAMCKTFALCYCNDTITLLNGKIYRCAYSANGRNLRAIPYKEEDVVNLYDGSVMYLRNKLKYLVFDKQFDYACNYCDGRNYHLATVRPAEQISKPLEYEKCDDCYWH